MAFKNSKGVRVTYECSELIEELKNDIEEFGGDTLVYVWCKNALGVTLYVNYDFIDEDDPVRPEEVKEDEYLQIMTMNALLVLLEKENMLEMESSLKVLRKIKNLTQQELSDILNIPLRTIENWENGNRKPPEYINELIRDKLLKMTNEELENEKKYVVLKLENGKKASIVFEGSKRECFSFEDEARKKLSTNEQLYRNYTTQKYSEYIKEENYIKEYKKYASELSKEQFEETVKIGGKIYLKHILEFNKHYYNK